MIQLYAVERKHTLNSKKQKGWNFKNGEMYTILIVTKSSHMSVLNIGQK